MKKNVIVLLIDSLTSDCIGKGRTKETSTPFLDSLLSNSIFAPNVYSYGPYTDAATKGLWCSMPTMSDYGYYFSINGSDINPYKVFKENGYETYGFYYPYYMMSPKVVQYIDHTVYTSSYAFYANWRNFGYYAEAMRKRNLSETEIKLMVKSLELIFSGWIQYYDTLEKDQFSSMIIKEIAVGEMFQSVSKAKRILLQQYGSFKQDSKAYLYRFLESGMGHILAKIDPFDIDLHVDRAFLKNVVYKDYKNFFKEAHKKNVFCNLRNNKFSVKKTIKGVSDFLRTHDLYELKYPANYYLGINVIRNMVAGSLKPNWQYQPSARKQIEAGMDYISKRDSSRPFYTIFHVEEPHAPIAFFSYDIKDKEKIDDEINYIKPLVENCGEDFKGSLGYQLAVRYDDYCLKIIFDKLKEMELLDDTIVMVIADHGSSYLYSPVRKRTVNCFHKENYNIPMIIWDKNIKEHVLLDSMYTSADVYTTLYDYLGLNVNGEIQGISMLKEKRNSIITEYMGPGCPDMLSRDIWMSIRNNNWMLAYKINMAEEFNYRKAHQIFDLQKDPDEINNLARTVKWNDSELIEMAKMIGKRYDEIRRDRDSFIEKFLNEDDSFNAIKKEG